MPAADVQKSLGGAMARRAAKAEISAGPSAKPAPLIDAGLDALDIGFAIFDKNLKLLTSNRAFRALRGYPITLTKPGTDIIELYRFNAERGDYGPGDAEAQAISRMERVRERKAHQLAYELSNGRILDIRYAPIPQGGLVLSYADITEERRAAIDVRRKESQLHVALENMPSALAYTDDALNIAAVCSLFVIFKKHSEYLR